MFERLCSAIVATVLVACGASSKPAPAPPDNRSLFERLGGQPAINAVVHEFVVTTKADPRISQFFLNTDPVKLEQSMDDHVCSITGGGCAYRGKSMRDAHTTMKINDADFAAFMDDLRQVLVKLEVPEREGREVLTAFDGMKGDVVGH
ncbi:MAG TPA: group 1 truncated hemoglobin [Kofleriaceae bacterium]|jgi:hemoglobin